MRASVYYKDMMQSGFLKGDEHSKVGWQNLSKNSVYSVVPPPGAQPPVSPSLNWIRNHKRSLKVLTYILLVMDLKGVRWKGVKCKMNPKLQTFEICKAS